MGKSSAPAAPNYAPIAMADLQAAQTQAQLGEDQLQWGKDQFNTVWPYAQQYLQASTNTQQQEQQFATQQQQTYQNTYLPIEQQFASTAANYNSPARANANAALAEGDVANAMGTQRTAALQQLESYGIDPSQTRFGALDLGSRISQAAATAAAGTQSRINTEATGLGLETAAINTGRGYPSAINQTTQTGSNAGAQGISTANSSINTGVNAMGSPTSYFGNQFVGNSGATTALNTGFNNALGAAQFNAQQSANFMSGIGQLIGGGIGLYAGLA